MAKYTLLEIVQKVLSSLDGDEVNSITDTVESMQIARIVEDCYMNMVANEMIPEHMTLMKVTALSNATYPNYLQVPDGCDRIEVLKYNTADDVSTDIEYKTLTHLEPLDFLDMVNNRGTDDTSAQIITDHSGVKMIISNDVDPTYWTSFDDNYIVMDSFNSDKDSTLQASKTLAYGRSIADFELSDSFTPDIDDNLFPLLINEVKSYAYVEHKQSAHPKAEKDARRQRVQYQHDRHRLKQPNDTGPNYGRR